MHQQWELFSVNLCHPPIVFFFFLHVFLYYSSTCLKRITYRHRHPEPWGSTYVLVAFTHWRPITATWQCVTLKGLQQKHRGLWKFQKQQQQNVKPSLLLHWVMIWLTYTVYIYAFFFPAAVHSNYCLCYILAPNHETVKKMQPVQSQSILCFSTYPATRRNVQSLSRILL